MNAGQRLDQLEPLLSEAITVLDRHTVQLRQLGETMVRLNEAFTKNALLAAQQSDNISCLLDENVAIKDRLTALEHEVRELRVRIARLENEIASLKKGQAELKQSVARLEKGQTELRQGQAELNQKLDLILQKLS